jgi:serine/threonine protein kinase
MSPCTECRQAIDESARFCPFCGAATSAATGPADPFLGATVNGKFKVEALIGQGGMGRVYRARHLTLDRPVVLKMLRPAYSSDPGIAQRFQREARAASRLDHPNSIRVLDFGAAEDGTLFMAMEYLAGRDLARLVQEEFPLGEPRLARIGAQILSALGEAHARGIVHRDLKPENVMVEPRRDEPDFVKVLDFGIAKITAAGGGEPKLTQAGLVCGTPEYMSPEQARGAELDARSDLYSVGVILYQLATGDLPFASDTPVGFLTKHLTERPIPPRERRPELGISPALDALVARALEKDPAGRFQSADEMRAALLAVVAPVAAATEVRAVASARARGSSAREDRPAVRSRRPFWFFVAAMVLALLGGGAVVLRVERSAAERQAQRLEELRRDVTATSPSPPPSPPTSPPTPTPTPAATPEPSAVHPEPFSAAAPLRSGQAESRGSALFRKAEGRRASQDVDGAIRLYLAALDADPSLAEAEKKLALCYQLKGDTRRAAARYERYLATHPPDAAKVRAILGALQ